MTIGFIQTNPIFGEKKHNLEETLRFARRVNGDLLVMTELFNTGYTFTSRSEAEELAETIPLGPTTEALREESNRLHCTFVAGIPEKKGSKIFNSAVVVSEGRFVGVYRKLHLFYKEKNWFDPGDRVPRVFDMGRYKLGVMICFDWIFPETARILALDGADIIAHPSNIVTPYPQKGMRIRSLENGVFSITANRIGVEERNGDRFRFKGRSQVVNPRAKVLISAPSNKTSVMTARIDVSDSQDKKFSSLNDLILDRRTELYYRLTA